METEIKLPKFVGSWRKKGSSRKTSTVAFDNVDQNKLWKILKEMGVSDHLTCVLRNVYASQEATVRTEHGTKDWFQIGKGIHQGCMLSPCLLTSMQSTSCEMPEWNHKLESRLPREIISNLRYADDTTLMADSGQELRASH